MSFGGAVGAVGLSGAGGGFDQTLLHKTSPFDFPTIIRVLLADPELRDARMHPALSLIQGFLDDVDPINFGQYIWEQPIDSGKHVLHLIGVDDTFTPNRTSVALARTMLNMNELITRR